MPKPLTIDEVVYNYPEIDDLEWGPTASQWADAVSTLLEMLRGPTAPIALSGIIRLGTDDKISWRNTLDTLDASLFIDSSDRLIYDDGVAQKDLGLTGASGNVQHLSPSTDHALARFDGTMGTVLQNSGAILDDSDNLTGLTTLGATTVTATTVGATDVNTTNINSLDFLKVLPPIGSIIPFYDFNGAQSFDAAYWAVCDGSAATVGGTPETLPDLSGRYLVGFGTDGGGDNASAAWATAAVGNALHEISLIHGHTVDAHAHTNSTHTHGPGTLQFQVANFTGGNSGVLQMYQAGGGIDTVHVLTQRAGADGNVNLWASSFVLGAEQYYTKGGLNATASDGGAGTGNTSPGTSTTLSATQSIQPRSIQVRYIMRIK